MILKLRYNFFAGFSFSRAFICKAYGGDKLRFRYASDVLLSPPFRGFESHLQMLLFKHRCSQAVLAMISQII